LSLPSSPVQTTSPDVNASPEGAPFRSIERSRVNPPGAQEKDRFPRFEREGDRLVKIGWSKKNKSTYEHRASQDAVFAVGRHLLSATPAGSTFTMEEISPVPDLSDAEIPSYQVYLTLAWLRHTGTIEKKGCDRYLVRHLASADRELEQLWGRLPQYADERNK
jgi:hypothetical protein